ncbi:MAG: tetratricopeptide repeat protein [Kofleriaceae bacterium]|nr:tetratricopeptide repeat protein [Kofleriaceae bacterium]MCB9571520.1 tetratricopeptide repeat protein [Kofleriaceae bacterium]
MTEDDDVTAAIEAAYALDRAGDEHGAIRHYDRAWRLGVPASQRKRFVVGYGSTLRNVGRTDDAVAVLAEAVRDYPDYPALQAFLGLALHSAGQPQAALATMLGVVLDLAGAEALDGYERALGEYHDELLAAIVPRLS